MRNFENAKKIVIKIGTNTLTKPGTIAIDTTFVKKIARQISELQNTGRQVVIVTSGAIGMGAGQLKIPNKVKDTKMRQACAAIGQPLLMQEYRKAFLGYGITVAQVLLTAEVFNNRKTYLNLQNSIDTLLNLGVLPILNENDCVSTDEIGTAFGDNDRLSALVASKIDADLLIMLSDIDALYDREPRTCTDAKPMSVVYELTDDIIKNAGDKGSAHSTGGMKTKIDAVRIASNAGCRIVIANGRTPNVITKIIKGTKLGTVFMPKRKLGNRTRWILNSAPSGTISIDAGALKAIREHKSLLPSGVVSVKGTIDAGSVVLINEHAKAVASLSSSQIRELAGKHSTEIKKLLGPGHRDVIAIPEDIVFLDF
ncbi:MAG: glutamate 5-kinase [Candidatus Brocadiia bacterium]|nr:MAG: glutamate 5-kinase [Candidatus Brocadiia bacterium]